MARAFAAQGDLTQSRAGYDDSLIKWKSANPDVPIIEEAIHEYSNRWGARAVTTPMSPISATH